MHLVIALLIQQDDLRRWERLGQIRIPAVNRTVLRVQMGVRRLGAVGRDLQTRRLPRFSLVAVTFLASTGLYGTIVGGHTRPVLEAVSAPVGLTIDQVDITGNSETSQIDILQTIYMTGAQTLPGLDVFAAREAIQAMPWIKSAALTKVYPDRVVVEIEEKKPYAIWQRGQDVLIIDRDGVPIVPYSTTRFTDLPFVVGVGAERAASELIDRIEVVPELTPRVRAYIRVAERRWDLRLDNGVTIQLPEIDPIEAAAEVVRMDRETRLLSRDIRAVDMRVSDRMVIKLTPEAQERRAAALKEREKIVRQANKGKPV